MRPVIFPRDTGRELKMIGGETSPLVSGSVEESLSSFGERPPLSLLLLAWSLKFLRSIPREGRFSLSMLRGTLFQVESLIVESKQ